MNKKNNSSFTPKVGKTIQRLRQAYKLSLGDLAEQSGVSKSIISQIERNESNPTLSTIWRLSNALETTIENVFKDEDRAKFLAQLPENKIPVIKSQDGFCTLRVLSPMNTIEWVQWYEFTALPKGKLESEPHQSGSVEHLSVLEGNLSVHSGEEMQSATAGTTLRYMADCEHAVVNHGTEVARAWMVLVLKNSTM